MAWYLLAWQRATDFSGRSRRKEYWMFHLFTFVVAMAIGLVALVIGLLFDANDGMIILTGGLGIYSIVIIVPSLSVLVRRLHDIGKSGWWYFISLVPIIGGIILFVFTVLDSEPDRNEYGPNPKVVGSGRVLI
jgi:uncharacterized membrane protein YhaH (DUF805 family)